MTWKSHYERWRNYDALDEQLKVELKEIENNEKELEDAFYKSLDFGTAGMRGVIGPGTNRMNIYTVRKAAKGLAKLIGEKGKEAIDRGVVIAYDNRKMSYEFAMESAKVLATDGIKVYVFESLRPTPQLSFAVRKLETIAGIMITASHNPPEYNGFKVYGEDGGQLVGADSERLLQHVQSITDELSITPKGKDELIESRLLTFVGEEMDDAYESQLHTVIQNKQLVKKNGKNLSIVYTPLHGATTVPFMNIFQKVGFSNIQLVSSQAEPDENFSNVSSANPEEHIAFDRAMKQGEKDGADILIATDPDGDRVGIAAKNLAGEYEVLTGNQAGAIMLHYLLTTLQEDGNLPDNGVMIQSIVSSALAKEVARDFNVEPIEVLTGFKYIAEKIRQYEKDDSKDFIFGYEESYGYLIKPFVRDKDAIQAALLAAETALYYKQKNMSLFEALHMLYEKYGYHLETIRSFVFQGKEGLESMRKLIDSFRKEGITISDEFKIEQVEDYLKGTVTHLNDGTVIQLNYPKSNVLKYIFTDGSWICVRPSGTEPKLKLYFGVKGVSEEDVKRKLELLITPLIEKVKQFQN